MVTCITIRLNSMCLGICHMLGLSFLICVCLASK